MSGTSIEDSLTIAPRDEWVLFCNRDKFDLVTIYDGSSETFGVQDSPTASLVRAIYENEFRKYLKNLPVLMVGGLEAWKREFAGAECVLMVEAGFGSAGVLGLSESGAAFCATFFQRSGSLIIRRTAIATNAGINPERNT